MSNSSSSNMSHDPSAPSRDGSSSNAKRIRRASLQQDDNDMGMVDVDHSQSPPPAHGPPPPAADPARTLSDALAHHYKSVMDKAEISFKAAIKEHEQAQNAVTKLETLTSNGETPKAMRIKVTAQLPKGSEAFTTDIDKIKKDAEIAMTKKVLECRRLHLGKLTPDVSKHVSSTMTLFKQKHLIPNTLLSDTQREAIVQFWTPKLELRLNVVLHKHSVDVLNRQQERKDDHEARQEAAQAAFADPEPAAKEYIRKEIERSIAEHLKTLRIDPKSSSNRKPTRKTAGKGDKNGDHRSAKKTKQSNGKTNGQNRKKERGRQDKSPKTSNKGDSPRRQRPRSQDRDPRPGTKKKVSFKKAPFKGTLKGRRSGSQSPARKGPPRSDNKSWRPRDVNRR